MSQYGGRAAATARLVVAHFGNPDCFKEDFVASFTAKNIAPAGMLDMSGADIPRKLPSNNAGKLRIVNGVSGI